MTVSTTTRLGITRWSATGDPFSRAQMDASHAALEASAAMFGQGTFAARPAPGKAGRYYMVTSGAGSGVEWYDDGAVWWRLSADLSTYATIAYVDGQIATRAATVHTHTKAQITDFAHSHAIGDLPVAASGVSSATAVVRADDSRLSDARTPTAHSHAIADLPVAASGASSATQVVRADDSRLSNARTPTAHSHAIADLPVAASGASSATQVVRADDSRLSNARTPTAHTHSNADLTQRLGWGVVVAAAADVNFPSGWAQLLAGVNAFTIGDGNLSVAGGVITIPTSGEYEVSASAEWTTVGGGAHYREIRIESYTGAAPGFGSGTGLSRQGYEYASSSSTLTPMMQTSRIVHLTAGDKVRVGAFHNATVNQTIKETGTSLRSQLTVRRIA